MAIGYCIWHSAEHKGGIRSVGVPKLIGAIFQNMYIMIRFFKSCHLQCLYTSLMRTLENDFIVLLYFDMAILHYNPLLLGTERLIN